MDARYVVTVLALSCVSLDPALARPGRPVFGDVTATTKTQGDFLRTKGFSVEIDGVTFGGIRSIEGIETETDVHVYKDGEDQTERTRPGQHKSGKITITKDWSSSFELYNWIKASFDGKVERKSISVIFHNDAGEEATRVDLFDCEPLVWKGPVLNAKSTGHATEQITIQCKEWEMKGA